MTSYRSSEVSSPGGSGEVSVGSSDCSGAAGSARPSNTVSNACSSKRNPAPPASTTPASRRTCNCSGVCSRATCPSARAFSTTRIRSAPSSDSLAPFADSRTTVRMVPSTGFITAPSAATLASVSAVASTPPSISPELERHALMPRSTCDRITPEFPRAPMREPWEMAEQTAFRSFGSIPSSSSRTDPIVNVMLVPVSPSGTGYTLSRLIHSR